MLDIRLNFEFDWYKVFEIFLIMVWCLGYSLRVLYDYTRYYYNNYIKYLLLGIFYNLLYYVLVLFCMSISEWFFHLVLVSHIAVFLVYVVSEMFHGVFMYCHRKIYISWDKDPILSMFVSFWIALFCTIIFSPFITLFIVLLFFFGFYLVINLFLFYMGCDL